MASSFPARRTGNAVVLPAGADPLKYVSFSAFNGILDRLEGAINVREFGAVGDGVHDDAPAIQEAHDSLPQTRGGTIVIPGAAVSYLLGSHGLTFSKPVNVIGDGRVELTKGASLNEPAVVVAGSAIRLFGLHVGGQVGNQGDGITVLNKHCILEHIQVYAQGRDGIRLGPDGVVPLPGGAEAEYSHLYSVRSQMNGRHGLYVFDAVNAVTNNSCIIDCGFSDNGGDGIRIDGGKWHNVVNSFIEWNTGWGLNLGSTLGSPTSMCFKLSEGRWDSNTAGHVHVGANVRDAILDLPSDVTPTIDSGALAIQVRRPGNIAIDGFPLGRKVGVPASAGAAGTPGEYAADASYLYVCTASNTWKRVSIAAW